MCNNNCCMCCNCSTHDEDTPQEITYTSVCDSDACKNGGRCCKCDCNKLCENDASLLVYGLSEKMEECCESMHEALELINCDMQNIREQNANQNNRIDDLQTKESIDYNNVDFRFNDEEHKLVINFYHDEELKHAINIPIEGFVNDWFVDDVRLDGHNLVITFNVDRDTHTQHEPIIVNLDEFFNIDNYYNKQAVNDLIDQVYSDMNGIQTYLYNLIVNKTNVLADWNETNSESDAYIKNKPSIYIQSEVDQKITQAVSGKQDTIGDLLTIRTNASKGAAAADKLNTGLNKSDFSVSVQQSLDKADSAYLMPIGGISDEDFADDVVLSLIKANNALQPGDIDLSNYYTKAQINESLLTQDTFIAGKADKIDTYSILQVDGLLDTKADKSDTYTTQLTNALLSSKADVADVYTTEQVDDLLDAKMDKDDVVSDVIYDPSINKLQKEINGELIDIMEIPTGGGSSITVNCNPSDRSVDFITTEESQVRVDGNALDITL